MDISEHLAFEFNFTDFDIFMDTNIKEKKNKAV